MTPETYTRRRDTLRKKIINENLAGLFIDYAPDRFYFSGFELHDPQCNESAGYLLVTADGPDKLLTDPRYEDAAKRLFAADDIYIYSNSKSVKIREFLKSEVQGTLGVQADTMSVSLFNALNTELDLRPISDFTEEIRIIKEPEEIEAMRKSCALNHELFNTVESFLVPGRTEKEVAWDIEQFFRSHGAEELSFSSIVAVGPNAALPHAVPGHDRIPENGPVLIDVGCRLNDYCSDQTRTFWVGDSPSGIFKTTKDLVIQAQTEALNIIGPGLPLADAYHAARNYFEKHGVADRFTHSLGHGIGLETHEAPRLGPNSKGTLQPGMFVTVEPGLYYPDWGGVRWEYMVLITENGCDIL